MPVVLALLGSYLVHRASSKKPNPNGSLNCVVLRGGFLLLRFSSPFRSDVDQLVPFSFLASGPAAILASTSAEHEQAFSELQSIAMAVTAQHQGELSVDRFLLMLQVSQISLQASSAYSVFHQRADLSWVD